MPKYFKAATNTIGVPQKMVFVDKKGEPHLLPTLTKNKHIASHYGQSAVLADYNPKNGNLIKVTKGEYTDYKEKKKKQEKAAKDLVNATVAVETAAKKLRGRPRKNPDAPPAEKKARTPLTEEQKKQRAAKRAITMANKALANIKDLEVKMDAVSMGNDMVDNLLSAAIASVPKGKRGRPKKKV